MPRGCNPNSRANLKPFTKGSEKEVRKINSKGGVKSGEVRRKLKTFQELDAEYTTDDERKKMLDMLKKRAEQGNLRAWELYANYMGLKPAEKVTVATIDQEAMSKLHDRIKRKREDGEIDG